MLAAVSGCGVITQTKWVWGLFLKRFSLLFKCIPLCDLGTVKPEWRIKSCLVNYAKGETDWGDKSFEKHIVTLLFHRKGYLPCLSLSVSSSQRTLWQSKVLASTLAPTKTWVYMSLGFKTHPREVLLWLRLLLVDTNWQDRQIVDGKKGTVSLLTSQGAFAVTAPLTCITLCLRAAPTL